MDIIREHLIYKDVPTTVCMKSLTSAEHYELIRCLLATRTNNVSVCCFKSSNVFIQLALKKMEVYAVEDCSVGAGASV